MYSARAPPRLHGRVGVVADLLADPGDPEQLVHGGVAEERDLAKRTRERHRGDGREGLELHQSPSVCAWWAASASDAASKTAKSFASRNWSTSSRSLASDQSFASRTRSIEVAAMTSSSS